MRSRARAGHDLTNVTPLVGALSKRDVVRPVLTAAGAPAGGSSASDGHGQSNEVIVGPGRRRRQRDDRATDRNDGRNG